MKPKKHEAPAKGAQTDMPGSGTNPNENFPGKAPEIYDEGRNPRPGKGSQPNEPHRNRDEHGKTPRHGENDNRNPAGDRGQDDRRKHA